MTRTIAVWVIGLLATPAGAAEQIVAGQEVDQAIGPGETRSYEVSASAGEYLRFTVDPHGARLAVRLLRPDGSAAIVLNDARQHEAPVSLSLIAGSVGLYRLAVRLAPEAPAGKYTLRLAEARGSGLPDQKAIEAETALREGRILFVAETAQSRRAAIPRFQTSITLAREAGDRLVEKNALRSLGRTYNLLGESTRAVTAFGDVLAFARQYQDRPLEAEALNNLGLEHSYLGKYSEAVADLKGALAIWDQLGDQAASITPANNLALAYIYLGELETARQTYEQSVRILGDTGDRVTLGFARAGIASVFLLQGRYQDALDHLGRALEIWRAAGSRQNEAVALGNIGVIYLQLGEPRLALRDLEQALAIRRSIGDRAGEANALQNLGSAYQMLGQPEQALASFQHGLELYESIGRRREQSAVLNRMAALQSQAGRHAEAADEFARARAIAREIGDRLMEAIAATGLGREALLQGQPAEAVKLANGALELAQAGGYRPEQEGVLVLAARAEAALGRLDEAERHMQEALEIAESIRGSLAGADFRRSYFAGVRNRYDLLIDILMRQHREAEAFAVSERARARSLLELLAESRSRIQEGVDPLLLEREHQLRAALRVKVAAPEPEVQKLLLDYREVTNSIRARNPRYAALTLPEPLSLSAVQSEILDKGTLLLEYALGEERSYVWAVSRDSVKTYELPSRSRIEAAARAGYRELSMREEGGAVRALSRMLLGPLDAELGRRRLAVVTEGALQYIPFSALTAADGTALVATHEIVSLPSASTLRILREQSGQRPVPPRTVAVFGDPVFDRNDPRVVKPDSQLAAESSTDVLTRSAADAGLTHFDRLLSTRAEADAIAGFAGPSKGREFLDFDATREAAASPELAQYRIVHFAVHGLLNNRHPELSGLVFSLVDRQGRARNGFLQAFEVYNLRLSADLVVLSACQTAIGDDVKGEGLLGLSRGFMYAGAPRVVASLWKVPDRASAELMKSFYRAMLVGGMRPAAALRVAQAAIRKDPRTASPYYWAGFILQGEWN